MKRVSLRVLTSTAVLLATMILAVDTSAQQPAPRKEPDATVRGSTVDAWRTALPENEKSGVVTDEGIAGSSAEESFEQIERRLNTLEHRWMDAIKVRDAAALKRILADDFTLTSVQPAGALTDKTKYIESALRDWELSSYSFDKLAVRVYGNTAVVNALYRQRAAVAGKESSGDFLITDVWVKQDKRWRVVTRHTSQPVKAQ